jgi:hypothetical protein
MAQQNVPFGGDGPSAAGAVSWSQPAGYTPHSYSCAVLFLEGVGWLPQERHGERACEKKHIVSNADSGSIPVLPVLCHKSSEPVTSLLCVSVSSRRSWEGLGVWLSGRALA